MLTKRCRKRGGRGGGKSERSRERSGVDLKASERSSSGRLVQVRRPRLASKRSGVYRSTSATLSCTGKAFHADLFRGSYHTCSSHRIGQDQPVPSRSNTSCTCRAVRYISRRVKPYALDFQRQICGDCCRESSLAAAIQSEAITLANFASAWRSYCRSD